VTITVEAVIAFRTMDETSSRDEADMDVSWYP
jgi:hypothetical protein